MDRVIIASLLLICFLPELVLAAPKIFLPEVPFTSQAPSGKWSDQRQQDACEETVSLMAVKWARNEKINSHTIEAEIINLANWEQKKYGSFVDTSASSTALRILKTYFNFNNFSYQENITAAQIITYLEQGNLVIAPTNGKKLKNPYFSHGGPERHMVLIIGYDSDKQEFITNDPGTRHGHNYRYPANVLFAAIRDYPTGNHQPIKGVRKNIIIIKKI